MKHSFDFRFRKISSKEYAKKFDIPDGNENKNLEFNLRREKNGTYKLIVNSNVIEKITGSSKNAAAYKVAEDVRKFEIDKYWQRTLYFWGIITAIYVAYFNILKEYRASSLCQNQSHGSLPLLVFSALGLFFCFSWLLSSIGSKHWQKNWEHHIDMLEDEITGPLFKVYKQAASYSVSGINIMAGRVVSLCAFGLFSFESVNFVKNELRIDGIFASLTSMLMITFAAISLLVYKAFVKGNMKKSGAIDFDYKEYNELHEK